MLALSIKVENPSGVDAPEAHHNSFLTKPPSIK